jgi:hypothetical protein
LSIKEWKLISPWVVLAVKFGAIEPRRMRGCSAVGVANPRRRRGVGRALSEAAAGLTDHAAEPRDRNTAREAKDAIRTY